VKTKSGTKENASVFTVRTVRE